MSMQFPVMRFELEGMKHQLLVHLGKYHADLERLVDESCQKVIDNFDFEAVIRVQMEQALTQAIQEELKGYWSYGPGRKLFVQELQRVLRLEPKDEP